jgi:hypothetical protein
MPRTLDFPLVLPLIVLGFLFPPPAPAADDHGDKSDGKSEGKPDAGAGDKADGKPEEKASRKKGGGRGNKGNRKGEKGKKKPPGWAVLQIAGDLRVVKEEQIPDLKSALEKENEKAAAKAPKDKQPVPRKLTVVMGNFTNQKEAEKYLEKYRLELQAKKKADKAKKDDKKDGDAARKVPPAEVDL